MNFHRNLVLIALLTLVVPSVSALEPPTREQLEQYRRDGNLADRVAAAYRIGNHRMSPALQSGLTGKKMNQGSKGLPTTGNQKTFALLISFSDFPNFTEASQVDRQLFGDGNEADFPYDPLNNTWGLGGLLSQARIFSTATVLDSGHVLVTGGVEMNNEVIPTAEIFDPATTAWTVVSPMAEARIAHQATLLLDGSILVTGGVDSAGYTQQASNTGERFAKPDLPPRRPGGRVGP